MNTKSKCVQPMDLKLCNCFQAGFFHRAWNREFPCELSPKKSFPHKIIIIFLPHKKIINHTNNIRWQCVFSFRRFRLNGDGLVVECAVAVFAMKKSVSRDCEIFFTSLSLVAPPPNSTKSPTSSLTGLVICLPFANVPTDDFKSSMKT